MLVVALAAQQMMTVRIEEIDLPVSLCFSELLMGITKRSMSVLELKVDNYNKIWKENGKAPMNYEQTRIGSTSSIVTPSLYKTTRGYAIDIVGTRTQTLGKGRDEYLMRHRAQRQWYVDESGKLIAEEFELTSPAGRWTMSAVYEKETFTVTLSDPKRGKRVMGPVTPGFELTELTEAPFKPMYSQTGQILQKEKKFRMLDPITGGPLEYKAYSTDDFVGKVFDTVYKGQRFAIEQGKEKTTVFVTNSGNVLRVEMPRFLFMELDAAPN